MAEASGLLAATKVAESRYSWNSAGAASSTGAIGCIHKECATRTRKVTEKKSRRLGLDANCKLAPRHGFEPRFTSLALTCILAAQRCTVVFEWCPSIASKQRITSRSMSLFARGRFAEVVLKPVAYGSPTAWTNFYFLQCRSRGAKFQRHTVAEISPTGTAQRRPVGTFVGMLFHNGV